MGVLDLFNPAVLLKMRLIVYGVLLFFSFFIFVGTSVMRNENGDICPLYLSLHLTKESKSSCNYPIAISIIFQLIYILFRIVTLLLVVLGKFTPDMILFSDLAEFVYVVVDLTAFFLIFIAACVLSAGTNETCGLRGIDCDKLDFYPPSKAAQAGAWISTFVWLFIGLCGFITLWRAGKIPFLQGSGTPKADSTPGPDTNQPPIETPPNHPDDPPKY